MKKLYFLVVILVCSSAFAQVGIATTNPNAQLDIRSSNQSSPSVTDGLLIPRIDTFPANPGSDQQGMLIYLTTASGSKSPGFYYWDFPTLSWTGMNSTTSNDINITNFEDFVFDAYAGSGGNDNQYAFTPGTNGTGATSTVDGTAPLYISYGAGTDYAGIHRLYTGTGATGKAAIGSFNYIDRIRLGSNQTIFEVRVRFLALSNGTQVYTGYFGLSDMVTPSASATAIPNGVLFKYTTAGLVGTCIKNSSVTNTSSVALVANTWYKLKAIINAAGTSVDFFLNDSKIGSSVTTNIPTAPMKFVFLMDKTAGTANNPEACDIDYISWRMVR